MKLNAVITREMLTACMADRSKCLSRVNAVICSTPLNPWQGATFGKIRVTPDGCWCTLNFPQWVRTENPDGRKSYRFRCTPEGEFLAWV